MAYVVILRYPDDPAVYIGGQLIETEQSDSAQANLRREMPKSSSSSRSASLEQEPEIVELFRCSRCKITFDNIDEYVNHTRIEHFQKNKLELNTSQCKSHPVSTAHPLEPKVKDLEGFEFECGICDLVFPTFDERMKHGQTVHKKKHWKDLLKCKYCAFPFSHLKNLYTHFVIHSKAAASKPFKCKLCYSGFSALSILNKHCRRVHKELQTSPSSKKKPDKITGKSPYILKDYTRTTDWKKTSKGKEIINDVADPLALPGKEEMICRESNSSTLWSMDTKSESNLSQATTEEMETQDSNSYENYGHTDFQQPKIENVFNNTEDPLPMHPFLFQCIQCSESFDDPDALIAHNANAHIHKSEPQPIVVVFPEPTSPETYNPYSVNQLVEELEPVPQPPEESVEPEAKSSEYECAVCDSSFSTFQDRQIHNERLHPMGQRICKYCGNSFKGLTNLYSHVVVHFGSEKEKPFQCQICGGRFRSLSQLISHKTFHKLRRERGADSCLHATTSYSMANTSKVYQDKDIVEGQTDSSNSLTVIENYENSFSSSCSDPLSLSVFSTEVEDDSEPGVPEKDPLDGIGEFELKFTPPINGESKLSGGIFGL